MICHFCDKCTYNQWIDHEEEIAKQCPEFSRDDYMCSICLGLVFQPMITDCWQFRNVCKACVPKISLTTYGPKIILPNYPLRNQLNNFLEKVGLKPNVNSNYGVGVEIPYVGKCLLSPHELAMVYSFLDE